MLDIRKKVDEQYARIGRASQELDIERRELVRIQDNECAHALSTGEWCDDCDKYLGPLPR